MTSKVCSERALAALGKRLRRQGKRIVFTNGCFDLLHAGHVDYLARARRMGHVLVVGLNSDRSVRALKGQGRPIYSETDRARILSALACVDYVVLFDHETPVNLIRALQPHVLVKGADWQKHEIAGSDDVLKWGGLVRRVPLLKGRSTTRTISKLQRQVAHAEKSFSLDRR